MPSSEDIELLRAVILGAIVFLTLGGALVASVVFNQRRRIASQRKTLEELAQKGLQRVLVFSPAFVADCLETIYEIQIEAREEFLKAGGEELQLVESLNDSSKWISALANLAA